MNSIVFLLTGAGIVGGLYTTKFLLSKMIDIIPEKNKKKIE